MTVTLLFLTALAAVAASWLSRQGLAAKPWLETGPVDGEPGRGASPVPAAKLGLGVFIVVAATLLVLLVSSYSMRMEMPDWSPPPQPTLLWANTVVLVLASLALHRATLAARRGDRGGATSGLLAGGGASLVFVIGQALVWHELASSGYLPANNPADAFFYLITGLHGLHVLGGLIALGGISVKLWRCVRMDSLLLSMELCATYWHFLLLAWIMLFGTLVFSPSFDRLIAICTATFR